MAENPVEKPPNLTSLPISDQLIRATARIECANPAGEVSCGTGFFFRVDLDGGGALPLLVTNRHVVESQATAVVHITVRRRDDRTSIKQVRPFRFDELQRFVVYHPTIDLAGVAFGPVEEVLRREGLTVEYVTLIHGHIVTDTMLDECRALEDLIMIGYPNGIWDSRNNRPVVRRASSATPIYEDYNDEPKFLIDCPCFPGSSGSPVFLFNEGMYTTKSGTQLGGTRVALVGVLHAGFLHLEKGRVVEAAISSMPALVSEITIPNSIGICLKASELQGLVAAVKARVTRPVAA
jgi:hypothetical protein